MRARSASSCWTRRSSKEQGCLGQVVLEGLTLLGIESRGVRRDRCRDVEVCSFHDGGARLGRQLDGDLPTVLRVLLDRERASKRNGAHDAGHQALGESRASGDVSDRGARVQRDVLEDGQLTGVDPVRAGVARRVQGDRSQRSCQVVELGRAHNTSQS